jgi:RHS repeat-associated protein
MKLKLFPRACFVLCSLWLLALSARAQGDGRKAYVQVTLQGSSTGSVSDYQIYTVDEKSTSPIILADNPSTTPITISQAMVVKPGQLYAIRVTSSSTGSEPPLGNVDPFTLNIQAPPGFTVFVGTSNNATPSLASPQLTISGSNLSSSTTYSYYFQLVDDQALAPAPAGRITRMDVGDFVFQLGMGSIDNGKSAGRLEMRNDGRPTSGTYGLATSVFDYHSIYVTAPGSAGLGWVNVSSGVDKIETGQVKAVRSYVGTTSFTVSFYAGDGSGTYNSSAYATYAIDKITSGFPANYPSGSDCLRITETQGSATIYHYVFRSTSSDVWTLIEGTSGDERIEQHTSATVSGNRQETILVKNSATTTLAKTVRTWVPYASSEVLGEEDVYSNVGGSADTITTYTYGTTGAGTIGKVASVTHPDGGVVSFTYYDDAARLGQVKTVTEPWGASSTKVTTYDYDGPTSALKEYILSAVTTIGGTTTAKTTYDYHSFSSLSSADTTPRPLVHCTATTYTLGGSSPSAPLTTDTVSYMKEDGDYVYTDRPYSIQYPDGRQQVFRYEKGSYSGGTFTAGSGSAWRTWIAEGSHTGGSATTSILGLPFQSIGLVANQSTLTEVVRNGDDTIAYQKTYVWDGTAFDTTYPIATTANTWTDSVRQLSSTALNGVAQSWTWNGALLATATDGTGIVQTYAYDSLNRVSSVTKAGVASYDSLPSQYDQTLTYTYDAANHVVTETHSGNSLTRSTTHTYDGAGRLLSTTLPDGETTSLAYSFITGGDQVVTTLSNGGTVTTQTYTSGQTKQTTGATDVDRYFSYTVESDGEITSRVDLASSSSSRWKKVKTDCIGRTTVTTQPGYTGLSDMVTTNTYDGTTGLLTKISRTGLADEFRSYGYMGQLVKAGLDVSADGTLDYTQAADRVTDYSDSGFVKISSVWWALSESKIYPSSSSPSTSLVTNQTFTRLTGWSSGLVSETDQKDRFGNTTATTSVLDASKKRVTTSTAYPGVSSPAMSITVNGLSTQSTTPDGRGVTATYDGLGRLYTSVDSRTGTTTYTYTTNGSYATDQVYTVTDPASAVTTYAYDTGGRVSSIKNANNDYAYYAYDTSNRVTNQWGGAIMPVKYTYDSYGQVSEQDTYRSGSLATWSTGTWPTGQTADATLMTYDAPTGLLTQKKDAANNSTDYTYNQQGQVATRLWSRLNSSSARISTTYSYASLTGELTGLTYNDGTPNATYTYDRMGLMLSAGDIYNGSSTETRYFEYDGYQRLITEKNSAYQGSRWLTYTYESGTGGTVPGRASGYTVGVSGSLAQDLTSLYAYDSAGRIGSLAATQYGISGTRTFTYTYGSGSSLVTGLSELTTTGYSQTRAYETNRDLLNQFKTQFTISSVTTTKSQYDYTFNTLGQRVTAKQSGDAYADLGVPSFYTYAYDSRGEVTAATGYLCVSGSVTNYTLPMPGRAYAFAYDAAGNRTSATCTTNGTLLDTFTSNNLNQYTSRDNHSLPVSGTLDSGAKILVNGALADRQGNYWSADVLLSNGSGPAYNGAIPLKVGKAGSPDKMQSTSVAGFLAPATENSSYITYDADGNLTCDGHWIYTWDAENRLTSMTITSAAISAGTPGKKLEFSYDSTGRRTSKKVSTWSGSAWVAASEVRFVYQGWNLVAELDTSGNRVRTYAWGLDLASSLTATGGIAALVQFVDYTGTATAYLPGYDGSGNVATITQDNGTIVAAYEYGPFGELLRKDGAYAATNPFRNATKYTDNESGYVYYGTRYYDPRNGRFVSRDTIGELGGLNLYAFVGNNPSNAMDVLGRDAFAGPITWRADGSPIWGELDGPSGLDRQQELVASMNDAANAQHMQDMFAAYDQRMAMAIYLRYGDASSHLWVSDSMRTARTALLGAVENMFSAISQADAADMKNDISGTNSTNKENESTTSSSASISSDFDPDHIPNIGPITMMDKFEVRASISDAGADVLGPATVNANYIAKTDPVYQGEASVVSPRGYYTIGAHGSRMFIYSANGKAISPQSLAKSLLTDPTYKYKTGTPIILYACNTGAGAINFASMLANILNVPVTAPNNLLWWISTGGNISYVIGPSLYYDNNGVSIKGPDGQWHVDMQHLGKMVEFFPKGK